MEKPILPNNFETESKPSQNDGENALSETETSPESGPKTPKSAAFLASLDSPPRVGEGRGEGSVGAESLSSSGAKEEGSRVREEPKKKRGPKTARGKRAISRNAILSSHPVVIAGLETIEDWQDFESEIAESWQPEGAYERELARDIAFGLWRLRRCRIHESAVLGRQVDEAVAVLQQSGDDDGNGA